MSQDNQFFDISSYVTLLSYVTITVKEILFFFLSGFRFRVTCISCNFVFLADFERCVPLKILAIKNALFKYIHISIYIYILR